MAESIPWHGMNKRLTAAKDDRLRELNVFNNGVLSVSCWQLSPQELVDLVTNGGKIYLAVMYGPSQPPVFVGSEDEVRQVVIDYGQVWKKEKV